MNRIPSHMDEVNLIAKLADVKQSHYETTLLLHALLELLEEKQLIRKSEVVAKARQLDASASHPNRQASSLGATSPVDEKSEFLTNIIDP